LQASTTTVALALRGEHDMVNTMLQFRVPNSAVSAALSLHVRLLFPFPSGSSHETCSTCWPESASEQASSSLNTTSYDLCTLRMSLRQSTYLTAAWCTVKMVARSRRLPGVLSVRLPFASIQDILRPSTFLHDIHRNEN
jgi:hypothetical protein